MSRRSQLKTTMSFRANTFILLGLLVAQPLAAASRAEDRLQDHSRETISVRSGRQTLAGTLLVPHGPGPHPAVVLIPGSRGSHFLPEIAEDLARRGIAVLDLQKRGVGGSTGRWDRQSFNSRADDVMAGMDILRTRPDVDPARLGVMGHSQGGWIAQIVAARRPDVAFTVLLASPAHGVREQILTDELIHRERAGMSTEQAAREVAALGRRLAVLRAGSAPCRLVRAHYLCHIIGFEPGPYLARIQSPVLALFGELDPMAPPEPNADLIRSTLRKAGNDKVTVHVLPRANHQFWAAHTGLRDEYPDLRAEYVPGFLDLIGDWVVEQAARPLSGAPAWQPRVRRPPPRRLSVSGGVAHIAYQDVIHSPLVHRATSALTVSLAYRRDAAWVRFAEARVEVLSARRSRYPIHMHDHDNLPHTWVLTDAALGVGRRMRDSVSALGFSLTTDVHAGSYGYGIEENFGYLMHTSLSAWMEREIRATDRSRTTGRVSVPLVSWLARSPYLVNDDQFIENIDAGSPFRVALNFLRDGSVAGWRERQGGELLLDHEFLATRRLTLGATTRLSVLRIGAPRPFASVRSTFGVTTSFRY